MSVFKINLKPVVKDRDYEVKFVNSGRKDYKCSICGKDIKAGESSISFTKRVTVGLKTTFNTFRTCHPHGGFISDCTVKKAKELGIENITSQLNS